MQGINGFAYDPIFFSPACNKTFAEMTPEEKNKVSHRKIALQSLLNKLNRTDFVEPFIFKA